VGADPRIEVIALYLEGLRNGLQFVEVARRGTATKPVIAIKGGMGGGAAATMSHTGSLAALSILNEHPNTDIIVLGINFQVPYLSECIAERLAELQPALTKPLILSLRGFSEYTFRTRRWLVEARVPSYSVPMVEPLAIAVDIWKRYGLDFSQGGLDRRAAPRS